MRILEYSPAIWSNYLVASSTLIKFASIPDFNLDCSSPHIKAKTTPTILIFIFPSHNIRLDHARFSRLQRLYIKMFDQALQQIGSVAANYACTSTASDKTYDSLLRTKVEDKLYYLKDTNTSGDFDELVDAEVRRITATISTKPSFIERVCSKFITRIIGTANIKSQVMTCTAETNKNV